jgi:CrcB protein
MEISGVWMKCVVVGLGGFLGANARYLVGGWVQTRFGAGFPYGTFLVNITGCFILGLFARLALELPWREEWRLFFAIGILGAYTTFSTFSYETLQLIAEGRRYHIAALNIVFSVLLGLFASYGGVVTARLILSLRGIISR